MTADSTAYSRESPLRSIMKMRKTCYAILIAVISTSGLAADQDSATPWESKHSRLFKGLTRAGVEKIFPPRGSIEIRATGGAYGLTYNVSRTHAINLSYDWKDRLIDFSEIFERRLIEPLTVSPP